MSKIEDSRRMSGGPPYRPPYVPNKGHHHLQRMHPIPVTPPHPYGHPPWCPYQPPPYTYRLPRPPPSGHQTWTPRCPPQSPSQPPPIPGVLATSEKGIIYESREDRWCRFFKLLCEYKSIHGNCRVITTGKGNQLGMWVATQRKQYNQGKLSQERIEKLNDIGFDWQLNARRKPRQRAETEQSTNKEPNKTAIAATAMEKETVEADASNKTDTIVDCNNDAEEVFDEPNPEAPNKKKEKQKEARNNNKQQQRAPGKKKENQAKKGRCEIDKDAILKDGQKLRVRKKETGAGKEPQKFTIKQELHRDDATLTGTLRNAMLGMLRNKKLRHRKHGRPKWVDKFDLKIEKTGYCSADIIREVARGLVGQVQFVKGRAFKKAKHDVIVIYNERDNTCYTHEDPFPTFLVVLCGTKIVWIAPPGLVKSRNEGNVYPDEKPFEKKTGETDEQRDERLKALGWQRFELKVGEGLEIPDKWVHCVRSVPDTLAVSFKTMKSSKGGEEEEGEEEEEEEADEMTVSQLEEQLEALALELSQTKDELWATNEELQKLRTANKTMETDLRATKDKLLVTEDELRATKEENQKLRTAIPLV